LSVDVSIENVSPVEVSVSDGSIPIEVSQFSPVVIEVDGRKGLAQTGLGVRNYSTTSVVPRTGDPFLFFVADDDGNGPAIGFWDGANIQICVSLTI